MTDPNIDDVMEPTRKQPKRKSVSLTAGEGAKALRLTILARKTAGDRGETVVTTTDAKKKTTRGMTQRFDTFEQAVNALWSLLKDAEQKGWVKRERAGGFKARPDAFKTIPVAPKGAR